MRFAKYHGLGNDFLVVDLRTAKPEDAAQVQDPVNVIALCDRQFGVGGDGVLAVLPSIAKGDDARMRVLNSDGSEAEMCGNGLRCVVQWLRDHGGVAKDEMAIDTGAGRLVCQLLGERITVSMGAPRLTRAEIPMVGPLGERCIDQPIEITGQPTRTITCVSMGNPHAVTFVSSREEARHLAETVGPSVERHAYFPQRTNAEFAFVKSRTEIDLVVWERGAGMTLACGTGACATVVAAILTGRCDEGPSVRVNLPGGSLDIQVMPELSNVKMSGPAQHVFDAEIDLGTLRPRPR
jgi:diaminopimelate epimerase